MKKVKFLFLLISLIFISFVFISCSEKINIPDNMVMVEKGSFMMLMPGNRPGRDGPTHEVSLTYNFLIGKNAITFEEYDLFCEDTDREKPNDEGFGRDNNPVINVTWWDAIAYCNWLSIKEGLKISYDIEGNLLDSNGNITTNIKDVEGYRLPTEAEWEYAAQGGNKSNSEQLEIYGMFENLYNWTTDWENFSIPSTNTDPYRYKPIDLNKGSFDFIECDCCSAVEMRIRVARSFSYYPSYKFFNYGFRIARTFE